MKAKVERGDGFRGILDYALGKDGGNAVEIIGGNMHGTDSRALAAEFGLSREARPGVKSPVWHTSLSLPPGERIDSEKWAAVADDFIDGMGLTGHQWCLIRHHDTDHDHVHIVASRIALDGEIFHGKFEAKRAIALTQQLEERHGLTRTKGLEAGPSPKKAPSRQEIEQAARTGDAPPRLMLQQIIDAALEGGGGSVFDLMDRLEAAGVTAIPNTAKTGKMNGFAFEFAGIRFKGSDLGKSYTWKGLQERGVTYEQERDGEALRARAGEALAAAGQIDGGRPMAADPAPGPAGAGSDRADGRAADGGPDAGDRPEGDPRPGRGRDESGLGERREGPGAGDDRGRAGGDDAERDGQGRQIVLGDDPQSGGSDGGAGHPDALDSPGRSGSVRPDDWSPLADRVADLATGAYPSVLEDRPGDPVSPATEAKRKAWDAQHGALQSPAYRLTLMSRADGLATFNVGKEKGPKGTEKTYSASEVRALIPYLSSHNAKGRDVYVTPMDPGHHYIVVDDMTEASLSDFLAAGYAPALIQESSAGNRQAILKVPKLPGKDEQQAANAVVVDLNRRYGDPRFGGVIHPFRMAGFSNKKAGRQNAFTRLLKAAGGLCARTLAQLDAARQRLVQDRIPTHPSAPSMRREGGKPKALPAPASAAQEAFDRARMKAVGLAEHMGWGRDESRLDHRAAQEMSRSGWGRDDIAAAILARSPDLVERHRDPLGYAIRTAENASIDRAGPPEPQGDHPQDDQPKGPGDM